MCISLTIHFSNFSVQALEYGGLGQCWASASDSIFLRVQRSSVVRWPAVGQARVHISARRSALGTPGRFFPSERTRAEEIFFNACSRKWREARRRKINEWILWMWLWMYVTKQDKVNKKSGRCHQPPKKTLYFDADPSPETGPNPSLKNIKIIPGQAK